MAWLSRSAEVVCTELEEGAVLLDMGSRTYFSLNATGLAVWNLIDAAGSREELLASLGGGGAAPGPVAEFIHELEREGLVAGDEAGGASESQPAPDRVEPAQRAAALAGAASLDAPELIKHDEPMHEVTQNPFDPQLPLAE